MRLYLVQHAEAKSKMEDPLRPLSATGRKSIKKMAKYAENNLRLQIVAIIHSDKLRAKQTAEVLAGHLEPTEGVKTSKDLEPLADPRIWQSYLAEMREDIMLVGHLPHLSKLSGLLLTGNENKEIVGFKMGGIVCFERDESGRWAMLWMVTPEIMP